MVNVYTLRGGPQIGGGTRRPVHVYCQTESVREIMSERACKKASESDRQGECVRERVREHVREHVRENVRENVKEQVRERQSQIVRDCVSELHCVRAGSMSRVSAPLLTGFR